MGNKQRIGKHTNGQKVHEKGVNIDDPQRIQIKSQCVTTVYFLGEL